MALLALSCGQPEANVTGGATFDEPKVVESAESTVSSGASTQTGPSAKGQSANRFAPGGEIADAQLGKYYVAMTCEVDGKSVGTITFDMWTEGAPITTRNFLRLVDEGFYNGLTFHRILRDFMVQGGDPQGNGLGGSPHGKIKAEFSEEPERQHGYGVLSMARGGHDINSASSQFFLCCDESQSVWGLDGSYTSFGKMTSGVETLEAIANVPVQSNGREKSQPMLVAKITEAKVVEGTAPTREKIERPEVELDLGGEPRRVRLQQIMVAFKDVLPQGIKATRTEDEAKALAAELKQKLEGGAEMTPLVREYSELPASETDETPGSFTALNNGVRDRISERQMYDLQKKFQKRVTALQEGRSAGKLSPTEFQEAITALQEEFSAARVAQGAAVTVPRASLDAALNESAFKLKVGEVVVLDHDPQRSSLGYRVIKRLE